MPTRAWFEMRRKARDAKEQQTKAPSKHVLHILKAADTSDRTADFGSIRFPGSRRPLPSKYARVARSTADTKQEIEMLIPLLTETWGLAPPCALISIVSEYNTSPDQLFQGSRQHLIFRRGLADAAVRMNAWVVTDGLSDGVASLAGHALKDTEARQREARLTRRRWRPGGWGGATLRV